jgi:hypothetical protein
MITEAVIVDDWIEVRNGRVVARGAGDWGGSLGFSGECQCGHRWRLKRKTGTVIADEAADFDHPSRTTSGTYPAGLSALPEGEKP